MGISIGSLKPSMTIIYNGELYNIITSEHAKLGRGGAFCRVKVKNLKTDQVLEYTLRESDKIEEAFTEQRKLQYLYKDDEIYHFMALDTYEDLVLDKIRIKDKIIWLKENQEFTGRFTGAGKQYRFLLQFQAIQFTQA